MDSTIGQYINNALHHWHDEEWEYQTREQVKDWIYSGMHLFTIFMVAFFFLFVYYCIFGFVVGAITESNTADDLNDKPRKAITES